MRIRGTKPEFWRSKTIASVDWDARLVLKGVESYVDDNGVGKDSVVLIAADVFPHDLANDPETIARLSRALASLAEANLVVRYVVDGEALIYVRRWKSVQRVDRPNRGRYPRPDGTLEYDQDVDESIGAGQVRANKIPPPSDDDGSREGLANPREDAATGTEEQGNRGTETTTSSRATRSTRGTRIAENFAITDDDRLGARRLGFTDRQIDEITVEFIDYWRGVAGQRGTKLDWQATWRNWMRKEARDRKITPPGGAGGPRPSWEI
jgi:hypothetical protein